MILGGPAGFAVTTLPVFGSTIRSMEASATEPTQHPRSRRPQAPRVARLAAKLHLTADRRNGKLHNRRSSPGTVRVQISHGGSTAQRSAREAAGTVVCRRQARFDLDRTNIWPYRNPIVGEPMILIGTAAHTVATSVACATSCPVTTTGTAILQRDAIGHLARNDVFLSPWPRIPP